MIFHKKETEKNELVARPDVPQVPTGQHNLPLVRPRLQGDLQEQKRLRRVNEEEKGTWKVRISIFVLYVSIILCSGDEM